MSRPTLALDSWALMAFFGGEPAAAAVEQIILAAVRDGTLLMIPVINLGEIWYSTARCYSKGMADRVVEEVAAMGIEAVDAGWELTRLAADFKTRGGLSYADCFAAALAMLHQTELVTGDPEFRRLEDAIPIRWV